MAVHMVVDGDDRAEVIEVAALSHGTSYADAVGAKRWFASRLACADAQRRASSWAFISLR